MNGHYVIIINNEHCVYILANLAVKQKHQTQPKALTTLTLSLILQIFVIFKNNFFLKIPQQKTFRKFSHLIKKQRNYNIQRRSLYNSRLKKLLNVKSRIQIFSIFLFFYSLMTNCFEKETLIKNLWAHKQNAS